MAALLVAGAAGGALGFKLDDYHPPADDPVLAEAISGVRELPDGAYSFVVSDGTIRVYDIDRGHTLVKMVALPDRFDVNGLRGVAADAASRRLYVSFLGADETDGVGYLIAYDLVADKVLWRRSYEPSIDSMALTPDGRKMYMPCGRGARRLRPLVRARHDRPATRSDASPCTWAPTTRSCRSTGNGRTSRA